MTLYFSEKEFNKFKKLQNCKEEPWKIEKDLIEKTIKYVNYIKWIPWLQMIWIWNSISMNNANKNSDIDLFIVTKPRRIRITRIIITLIFQVLFVRKTKNKHKDRFCLSFFITTNALNLENISIKDDIYLYFWILHLKPILNYNKTWEKFIEENKKWCNFDNYKNIIDNNNTYIKYKKWWKINNFNWKSLDFIERCLKSIFIIKTKKRFHKLWNPFWVIINDNMLKFHDEDKRIKIRNQIIN